VHLEGAQGDRHGVDIGVVQHARAGVSARFPVHREYLPVGLQAASPRPAIENSGVTPAFGNKAVVRQHHTFGVRTVKILLAISLLLTLAACSTVPEPIRSEPLTSPGLAEVRSQPERFLGQPVRWGGSIVRVTNTPEESQIEVVSRPLHRDGEPRQVDHSDGRFIAIVPGFIDPAIYAAGRRITVTGTADRPAVHQQRQPRL
jgi:hypothetical protein